MAIAFSPRASANRESSRFRFARSERSRTDSAATMQARGRPNRPALLAVGDTLLNPLFQTLLLRGRKGIPARIELLSQILQIGRAHGGPYALHLLLPFATLLRIQGAPIVAALLLDIHQVFFRRERAGH